jgi:hypothetical protein
MFLGSSSGRRSTLQERTRPVRSKMFSSLGETTGIASDKRVRVSVLWFRMRVYRPFQRQYWSPISRKRRKGRCFLCLAIDQRCFAQRINRIAPGTRVRKGFSQMRNSRKKCGLRIAECGIRDVMVSRRAISLEIWGLATRIRHSAFRIPHLKHSAFRILDLPRYLRA